MCSCSEPDLDSAWAKEAMPERAGRAEDGAEVLGVGDYSNVHSQWFRISTAIAILTALIVGLDRVP